MWICPLYDPLLHTTIYASQCVNSCKRMAYHEDRQDGDVYSGDYFPILIPARSTSQTLPELMNTPCLVAQEVG